MKIMGILNATPDSFFGESRVPLLENAMNKAAEMIKEGAEILDIGGESTCPGCDPVTPEEEVERILPLIQNLRKNFPGILISVDTYHASTAAKAFEYGADILNDISALNEDKNIADVATTYHVARPLLIRGGRVVWETTSRNSGSFNNRFFIVSLPAPEIPASSAIFVSRTS